MSYSNDTNTCTHSQAHTHPHTHRHTTHSHTKSPTVSKYLQQRTKVTSTKHGNETKSNEKENVSRRTLFRKMNEFIEIRRKQSKIREKVTEKR